MAELGFIDVPQPDGSVRQIPADVAARLGLGSPGPGKGGGALDVLGAAATNPYGAAVLAPEGAGNPGPAVAAMPAAVGNAFVRAMARGPQTPGAGELDPSFPAAQQAQRTLGQEQAAADAVRAQADLAATSRGRGVPMSDEQALDIRSRDAGSIGTITPSGNGNGVIVPAPGQEALVARTLANAVAQGDARVLPDGSYEFVGTPDGPGALLTAIDPSLTPDVMRVGATTLSRGGGGGGGTGGGNGRGRYYVQDAYDAVPDVPSATLGAMSDLRGGIDQMSAAAAAGAIDENTVRQQGAERLGAIRQQQRTEAEQFREGPLADYNRRVSEMERQIQDVGNRRVDPEHFFGEGAGSRIGAAIAVAFGQLGSALSGGPNAALEILNRRISQDIEAQASNRQNELSALGARGQNLARFREILGDEQAARAAATAAQWDYTLQDIEARARGTQNPVLLANAQKLILQGRLAAMQAAVEAYQAEGTHHFSSRLPPGAQRAGAPASGGGAAAARPARPRTGASPGASPPRGPPPPGHSLQSWQTLQTQGEGRLGPSHARAAEVNAYNTTLQHVAEGAGQVIPAAGVRGINNVDTRAAWASLRNEPTAVQNSVRTAISSAHTLNQIMPPLLALAERSGFANAVITDDDAVEAQDYVQRLQAAERADQNLGVLQQFEGERMNRLIADPNEVNLRNFLSDSRLRAGRLRAYWRATHRGLNARLAPANLALDSPAGLSGHDLQ